MVVLKDVRGAIRLDVLQSPVWEKPLGRRSGSSRSSAASWMKRQQVMAAPSIRLRC